MKKWVIRSERETKRIKIIMLESVLTTEEAEGLAQELEFEAMDLLQGERTNG